MIVLYPVPCEVNGRMENSVKDCTLDYSWSNEDEGVFAANWAYTCDPGDDNIPNYAFYEVDEVSEINTQILFVVRYS